MKSNRTLITFLESIETVLERYHSVQLSVYSLKKIPFEGVKQENRLPGLHIHLSEMMTIPKTENQFYDYKTRSLFEFDHKLSQDTHIYIDELDILGSVEKLVISQKEEINKYFEDNLTCGIRVVFLDASGETIYSKKSLLSNPTIEGNFTIERQVEQMIEFMFLGRLEDKRDTEHEKSMDYYIDEDFSLTSYFGLFQLFREGKVSKTYKLLTEKFSFLFQGDFRDIYICSSGHYEDTYNIQHLVLRGALSGVSISIIEQFVEEFLKEIILLNSSYKKHKSPFEETLQEEYKVLTTQQFQDISQIAYLGNIIKNKQVTDEDKYIFEFLFSSNSVSDYISRLMYVNIFLAFKNNLSKVGISVSNFMSYLLKTNDFKKLRLLLRSEIEQLTLKDDIKNYLLLFLDYDYECSKVEIGFLPYINVKPKLTTLETYSKLFLKDPDNTFSYKALHLYNHLQSLYTNYNYTSTELGQIYKIYESSMGTMSEHDLYYDLETLLTGIREYKNLFFLKGVTTIVQLREVGVYLQGILDFSTLTKKVVDILYLESIDSLQSLKDYSLGLLCSNDFLGESYKKQVKEINSKLSNIGISVMGIIGQTFSGDIERFKRVLNGNLHKNIQVPVPKYSKFYFYTNFVIEELTQYYLKLVGSKTNVGEGYRPGTLYHKLKQLSLVSQIKDGSFSQINKHQELLDIHSKTKGEITQFKVQVESVTSPYYWCAGDYSKCCMGYNTPKIKDYITQQGFSIVNIYMNETVIGNSLVWFGYIDGKKSLIIDNIEINTTYKKYIPRFGDLYLSYLLEIQCLNGCSQIVLGSSFNDMGPLTKNVITPSKIIPLGFTYDTEKTVEPIEYKKFKQNFYSDVRESVYLIDKDTVFTN